MNGFLIDTNVLSEYNRPGVPRMLACGLLSRRYKRGLGCLMKASAGITFSNGSVPGLRNGSGRILPIDWSVANRWAELLVYCSGKGRPLPSIDSLLAATALEHDLALVTRNVKDFDGIGVTILNPWVA